VPALPGPTGKVGQALARIGTGPWFAITSDLLYTVGTGGAGESGELVFGYNDEPGDFGNNTGGYQIFFAKVEECICVLPPLITGNSCATTAETIGFTAATFAPPPDASLSLSTLAPGRDATHVAVFDVAAGDRQGYSATISYPEAFVWNGFLATLPGNSRVGTYSIDFNLDGFVDYSTWIRSTGADTAYADIDLSGTPTPMDAVITRTSDNVFTVLAPNGGDQDPATNDQPFSARITVTLFAGPLTNPPTPGPVSVGLALIAVDPDTGGADDGQGTPPETFSVEQALDVGCATNPDCDDADACTADTCAAKLCTSTILPGYDGATCAFAHLLASGLCAADTVDAKLDTAMDAKVTKAKGLLEQAAASTKAKKQRALTKKSDRQLAAVLKAIKKAAKKSKITPACSTTLTGLVTTQRTLIQALL
jgi:hypothetical protein